MKFILFACGLLLASSLSLAKDNANPEARAWLKSNNNPSAFATNRFGGTESALEFVNRLYKMGARHVEITDIYNEKWWLKEEGGPYSATLIVKLPKDAKKRAAIKALKRKEDPDTSGDTDSQVMFWWD